MLNERVAIVTGGGRGIGEAIAAALASQGATVVITSRTLAQVEAIAEHLQARGHTALALQCDVTDPQSIARLAHETTAQLGRADILVNNAGIATSAPLHRQTLADWNAVMAVNATGTFLCTQAFAPAMVAAGWGRIVNVASVAARTGAAYTSAYAASKHAVLGFTRSIAAELSPHGVTVNAVCPGFVDTDMGRETVERVMTKTGMDRERALAAVLQSANQRRMITPAEVAHAVTSLCADQAGGINGQALVIDDGGLRA